MSADARPREAGFSLIEVLIAMLLLSIAIIGTAATLDTTRKVTNTADRQLAASQIAEQAMEQMKGLPYASLGLSNASPLTRPSNCGTQPRNPDCDLNPGGTAYSPDGDPANEQALIFNGQVDHGGTSTGQWVDDRTRVRGYIFRYVTGVLLDCRPTASAPDPCDGTAAAPDVKRLTVAVWLANNQTPREPVVLTSYKSDPNDLPLDGGDPPCPGTPDPTNVTQVDCK